MAEYKKGDWVRVLHTDYEEEFPVGSVFRAGDVLDHGVEPDEDFDQLFFCNWEIEPWQPKVGERVRYVASYSSGFMAGKEATVVEIVEPTRIIVDTNSHWGRCTEHIKDLEPATITDTLPVAKQPAALTIVAGRYYKTRDGRKVGPMERNGDRGGDRYWKAPYLEGYGPFWCENGDFYVGDREHKNDLVAEWPADIAATVNVGVQVDTLAEEYGPVVSTAAVEKPKFKVGDIVRRSGKVDSGKRLRITEVVHDNDYTAEWLNGEVGSTHHWRAYEFELVTPASAPTTAIVALIENGQPLPATRPAVHTSAESADAEARRLASVHKGQEFGVFVLTGATHKEATVYEHEWQRLAVAGEKINAIKALRAAAGTDLKSAKDAVEFFTAYRAA